MKLGGDDPLGVRPRKITSESIAALNDVVMELVCGLASETTPTKGWAYTVVETLSKQSRALGVTPLITLGDVEGWQDEQ